MEIPIQSINQNQYREPKQKDQTITDVIITCGVLSDTNGLLANGKNESDRIAYDIFNENITYVSISSSPN